MIEIKILQKFLIIRFLLIYLHVAKIFPTVTLSSTHIYMYVYISVSVIFYLYRDLVNKIKISRYDLSIGFSEFFWMVTDQRACFITTNSYTMPVKRSPFSFETNIIKLDMLRVLISNEIKT